MEGISSDNAKSKFPLVLFSQTNFDFSIQDETFNSSNKTPALKQNIPLFQENFLWL
jgi:hypothetical protein